MSLSQAETNSAWGRRIIAQLFASGVRVCVISPGSRSTPLANAAARHPKMHTVVFWDERNAAFFALGHAKATATPAALICTSGTAGANYLPAIIEADATGTPLLALTADRPPELVGTGANQTIRQPGMFSHFVRATFSLAAPTADGETATGLSNIASACRIATSGPVHINVPFRKPLGGTAGSFPQTLSTEKSAASSVSTKDDNVCKVLSTHRRGLVLVGRPRLGDDESPTRALIEQLAWPTIVTPESSLGDLPSAIAASEWLLPHLHRDLRPDCVLHLGGPITSDALPKYLRQLRGIPYVRITSERAAQDPNHMTTDFFSEVPTDLGQLSTGEAAWTSQWKTLDRSAATVVESRLRRALGEPEIATVIRGAKGHLMIGNSMPIRYWQLTLGPRHRPVFANRGASGIDGLVATALGLATERPTTLYLGDVSLLHNLNALVQMRDSRFPLTVIVANNNGGNIFRKLPVAKQDDVFEDVFLTPHGQSFVDIGRAIGLDSHRVTTPSALAARLKHPGPQLIEVKTDGAADMVWIDDVDTSLREAL